METKTNIYDAKKIMGENFIGEDELSKIKSFKAFLSKKTMPEIPFSKGELLKLRKGYILILGLPVTIKKMRDIFGYNPSLSEPCFYNQDWYLKEDFIKKPLDFKWYLISKKVDNGTRGKNPDIIQKELKNKEVLPYAILATFTFFVYYFLTKEILWKNDFIWCRDKDSNGDRIYVGRYQDPKKINKNGFNIHRHLSIRPCYGVAKEII